MAVDREEQSEASYSDRFREKMQEKFEKNEKKDKSCEYVIR